MNDEYGGYVQAKPMFSYYLYIIACVIGAVVGIMIIKEHQKKITAMLELYSMWRSLMYG